MSDIQFNCAYTELKAPNELMPNPKNPNKHSQAQIERLALLIKHYGFRHPIIVSKNSGFIVAGHGRWEAALKLNLQQVPVDYQEFATPDDEWSFLVADNAVAAWSELDLSLINSEMINLGPDFDVDLLGIEDFKLDLNEKNENEQIDAIEPGLPELSGGPKTLMLIYDEATYKELMIKVQRILDEKEIVDESELFLYFVSDYERNKNKENL
jgi:hypothetical protein